MSEYSSLELIIGPMFAGKSSELIRQFNRFKTLQRKILVVNHIWNNRYNTFSVSTHDQNCIIHDSILTTDKLQKILEDPQFNFYDVIIIEELQFFSDAFEVITHITDNYEKKIIAAGLDGSSEREPIGDVLRLIPYANKVKKISALCKDCNDGTPGIYSSKMINSSLFDVGSTDKYETLCRHHFLRKHPELKK